MLVEIVGSVFLGATILACLIWDYRHLSEDSMSDHGPGDNGEGSGRDPPETKSDIERHVDTMIGDLTGRKVPVRERLRLGKALDVANKPEGGRSGMDKALGRAIRYSSTLALLLVLTACNDNAPG